jgi:HTH-type transcriptional regulator / antitoxin HigA
LNRQAIHAEQYKDLFLLSSIKFSFKYPDGRIGQFAYLQYPWILRQCAMPKPPKTGDVKTPGQLIERLLAERGWTQRVLAIVLNVDESSLTKVISGKRPVTADMALVLGKVFGVEPDPFLELQKSYELAQARIVSIPDPDLATRAALFGDLPVSDMIKRGWLKVKSTKDIEGVERELKRFFKVPALDQIETLPHAARKTVVVGESAEKLAADAQLVWLYRVKRIAEEMIVAPFSQFGIRRAIKELEPLMISVQSCRKVSRILASAGIRFVVSQTIGPAKIDGACLWLDENSPVIAMALRHDRIDNFWFTLRHEIEHVVRMHGRNNTEQITLDFELEGAKAGVGQNVPEEEKVANSAAANFGFREDYLQKFITRKSPFFREADVLGFANTVKVHPGIVVGRIQHATERFDLLRKYLVGVRHHVVAEAMVDGWGNVAPVD